MALDGRKRRILGSDIVGGEKWNYAIEHSIVYLYIEKIYISKEWRPPDVEIPIWRRIAVISIQVSNTPI